MANRQGAPSWYELLRDASEREKAKRVMTAMMTMKEIDIAQYSESILG